LYIEASTNQSAMLNFCFSAINCLNVKMNSFVL